MSRTKSSGSPSVTVSNCSFDANTAANEHTRAAVEALANAAKANAEAIGAIANALKGGTVDSMLKLGGAT